VSGLNETVNASGEVFYIGNGTQSLTFTVNSTFFDCPTGIYARVTSGSTMSEIVDVATSGQSSGNIVIAGPAITGDTSYNIYIFDKSSNTQLEVFLVSIAPHDNALNPVLALGNDFGTTNYLNKVYADSLNNIYVVGKYNASSQIQLKNLNGTNSSVYLPSANFSAAFLIKYDSSGNVIFATCIDGTANDTAYGVVTDSLNNVYITGNYNSNSQISLMNANGTASVFSLPASNINAAFLVKYDSSGVVLSANTIDGTSSDIGYNITTDSSNNFYITGFYSSNSQISLMNANGTVSGSSLPASNINAAFLVKYNSSGDVLFANSIKGSADARGYDVKTDSSNNIYIVGTYSSNIFFVTNANGENSSITLPSTVANDVFLVKYNSSGNVLFAKQFLGTTIVGDAIYGVIVDTLDNVYITGTYTSSSQVNLTNANEASFSSITLPATTNSAGFLIKYSPSGNVLFAKSINGTGNDNGYNISIDSLNNIYITGNYISTLSITLKPTDGINPAITLPATSTSAFFLIKYDSSGVVLSANNIDGTGNDHGYGITVDSLNNIYVTGNYVSTSNITLKNADGTNSLVSLPSASNAVFLAKYT
jgi:hypothetical protein